jgi:hypothetical protein
MANHPPFATLNHFAADLGIPSESKSSQVGISRGVAAEIAATTALRQMMIIFGEECDYFADNH